MAETDLEKLVRAAFVAGWLSARGFEPVVVDRDCTVEHHQLDCWKQRMAFSEVCSCLSGHFTNEATEAWVERLEFIAAHTRFPRRGRE